MVKKYITLLVEKQLKEKYKLKSIDRFIDKVFTCGINLKEIKHKDNKLYKYLVEASRCGSRDIILYNENIIVYSEEANMIITILDLPKEYNAISRKIKKERKDEKNGCTKIDIIER